MNGNLKASDRVAIVGTIDPDLNAVGTISSAWVSAAEFGAFMAIIAVGALGASGTVDAKIEQATDNAGAGSKDITGKAITQLSKDGTDDSDKQALINVRQGDLDIANAFTHIRVTLTVAAASSDSGALLLGLDPVKGTAAANDATSVQEII